VPRLRRDHGEQQEAQLAVAELPPVAAVPAAAMRVLLVPVVLGPMPTVMVPAMTMPSRPIVIRDDVWQVLGLRAGRGVMVLTEMLHDSDVVKIYRHSSPAIL